VARSTRASSRVDVAVFGACLLLAVITTVLPARMKEPAAGALRRSAVAPLVTLQAGAERWRNAWSASQRDQVVRDSLALQAFAVPALQNENATLRRILALGARLRHGFVPAEAVHMQGRDEAFTLTLTAGSQLGVIKGSPVVAAEGIVGMIVSADPRLSIATTFSHPDFRVSAMTADGSAFGIVSAHVGAGDDSPARYMLELRGVPFRNVITAGTRIYSTGLGGVFPRGVPIGTVVGELGTGEGWARTYLVRPAVNPGEISSVMILLPERVREGVDGAWPMVTSLDSLTIAIVAAGDSIVRADSAAQAMLRRAADSIAMLSIHPDSLPADTLRPQAGTGGRLGPDSLPRRPVPAAPRTAPVQQPPTQQPPAQRPPPQQPPAQQPPPAEPVIIGPPLPTDTSSTGGVNR
jgi:rod shape-determining protein MreC